MEAVSLRDAGPQDSRFLADMVVEAANWSPAAARPRVQVLADPAYLHYVAGRQRPADRGVVACAGDEAVGAAWFRLFPADDPAHGYVSPGVPELIIGVRSLWRAQGVGRALLRRLVEDAARSGYARLALSVERGNFARALYRSEGFGVVSSTAGRDTMVRLLR